MLDVSLFFFPDQDQYIHILMEHQAQVFLLDNKPLHFSIMHSDDIELSTGRVTIFYYIGIHRRKKILKQRFCEPP